MPPSQRKPLARAAASKKVHSLRPLRVPTYEPGGLRDALVAEGRKMFEENGASEMSLRELARRVGVSVGAPSRHFRGKEELLAAIAQSALEELAEERKQIVARNLPALQMARTIMLSYVRYSQTHPGLWDLMSGPRLLQEFVRRDVEDAADVSFSYFTNAIYELALESGWSRDQLHYLTHAAWSTEHGVAALILAGRIPTTNSGLDTQAMIEFTIDLFLSAVVAGPKAFLRSRAR